MSKVQRWMLSIHWRCSSLLLLAGFCLRHDNVKECSQKANNNSEHKIIIFIQCELSSAQLNSQSSLSLLLADLIKEAKVDIRLTMLSEVFALSLECHRVRRNVHVHIDSRSPSKERRRGKNSSLSPSRIQRRTATTTKTSWTMGKLELDIELMSSHQLTSRTLLCRYSSPLYSGTPSACEMRTSFSVIIVDLGRDTYWDFSSSSLFLFFAYFFSAMSRISLEFALKLIFFASNSLFSSYFFFLSWSDHTTLLILDLLALLCNYSLFLMSCH